MVSIILPTLGTRIIELKRLLESLEVQTLNDFEVIVCVQGNHDVISDLLADYRLKYKICNLYKRGLSHARNQGIKLISSSCELVTFSDDDCWYPKYAIERALYFYHQHDQAVCFQIYDPVAKELYKQYRKISDTNVTLRMSLSISSIEIFLPRIVIDDGLIFDEQFGLGASYPSGEENIFLSDMLKKGYQIKYLTEIIVYHLKPDWKNKEYTFKGKGALFSRLFNKFFAVFLIFIYAFKKRQFSENILADTRNMLADIVNYRKEG